MSVLVDNNTRLIVQGITGAKAHFMRKAVPNTGQSRRRRDAGQGRHHPRGLAGLQHRRGGGEGDRRERDHDLCAAAVCRGRILEAASAGIPLIVCITEGIPTLDMVKVWEIVKRLPVRLVGPNCPGVISPGKAKIGIMPGRIHKEGSVGIVSKSGTLTYEAVYQLTTRGIGQSTAIGIGGDPIIGTTHIDALKLLNEDPETEAIIMIGEIGGSAEEAAASTSRQRKEAGGWVYRGADGSSGTAHGPCGAIISGGEGTAASKMRRCRRGDSRGEVAGGDCEMMAKVLGRRKDSC